MALKYILQQVGYKQGLNPNDPNQRATLLRFVNEAVVELYQQSDMAGCYEEQYFKVNSDQTIALPPYVGQIRAMRTADTLIAIKLSQMRPRYNQFSWADEWRDWRIKGLQTCQTSTRNQSLLTISVKAVETPPIVVSLSGPNDDSAQVSENITMDAVTKTTANAYNDLEYLTKDRYNNYNVTVTDVDGNVISGIPNNKLQAKYQIVDISLAPWICNSTDPLGAWVEVLYKKSLPWMSNDNDEFPAMGYDNVIVNKCLQLICEEQGKLEQAIAYDAKATRSLAQIHEDQNRGTQDMVALTSNPHDRLFPRVGFGRDYQYGGFGYGGSDGS